MRIVVNKIKIKLIIFGIFLFSLIIISGCIEDSNNNENKDNNNKYYENLILGTWTRNETFENFTYIIDYIFYSNQSFFSGLKQVDQDSYNITIWGTYIIDDENIQLIVNGDIPSNSSHKYSINPEDDFFILYYEDGVNFDVLRRKN